MTHAIRTGTTDQIAYFRAYDTDGTAKVDITSATAGLSLSVFRIGASAVSISSLSDKAADNTTHSDGAIRQVQGNLYTVDLPDAAVASQCPSICVKGTYTGGVIEGVPHPIVGYDGTADAVGALKPTTAGRTLEVSASGVADANAVQISGDSVAADNAESFFDGTGYAGTNNVIPTVTTVTTSVPAVALAASQPNYAPLTTLGTNAPVGWINADAIASDAITAAKLATDAVAEIADGGWDEEMSGHTTDGTYGGRLVRAANSNVTVQITGSQHIAADVHEFQTDVLDADAIAASAVTEIQVGLALQSSLTTLTGYVDTEVAAIKAKTDNLPTDPADASDIAASFSTVNSTLATIAAYIDTEIAAIKAKTDNLPADPADASDIAASFSSIASSIATLTTYVDTEVAAIKAKTDNLPSDPADQSAVEAAITAAASLLATAAELAKVPKAGETRRFTQIAANAGSKTADVSIGDPL